MTDITRFDIEHPVIPSGYVKPQSKSILNIAACDLFIHQPPGFAEGELHFITVIKFSIGISFCRKYRRVRQFSNPFEEITDLFGFGLELGGIVDMLDGATTAGAEILTDRGSPRWRRGDNLFEFRFGKAA